MIPKPTDKKLFRDIEGQVFGRWKVISYAGSDNGAKWLCQCECGTVRVVPATNLFQGSKSCGCLQKEAASKTGKTLYLRRRKVPCAVKTHGKSKSPEYQAWNQMIQRCTNKKLRNYSDYGGRGIKVHETWMISFVAFYEHIGPRPSVKHSLDRINNDGNYEPGNVRWATDQQQRQNSRHPRLFKYEGQMLSIKEISRRVGIGYGTLYARLIKHEWPLEQAISQGIGTYENRKKKEK